LPKILGASESNVLRIRFASNFASSYIKPYFGTGILNPNIDRGELEISTPSFRPLVKAPLSLGLLSAEF
jgi:hypothetical protein